MIRRTPLLVALTAASAVVTLVGVALRPREAWAGVLVAAIFGLFIAIGAGTFLAVHGASGATWLLPIRRVPMSILGALPVPAAVLALALLLGLTHLYPWADAHAGEALAHGHATWLSPPAFLVRAGVIVAAWIAASAWLRRAFGDAARVDDKRARARASVAFLLVLGPTISLAAFDWAMSTDPAWTSTAYGVYGFAASLQAAIAAIALLTLALLPDAVRGPRIRQDLGTLLFAFSIFWAYIWFCQYMLIWYTNLPEEVPYYTLRLTESWAPLFWLSPLLCFVVPFVGLLSSKAKQSPAVLGAVSIVVLAGRWLDAYLLIAPARHAAPPAPGFAFAAVIAVLAGMALLVSRAWREEAEPPPAPPAPPPAGP